MRSRLQRESPLDLLLHTALDAVIVMSADGKIAEWNDCATDMFGWARDEALGRTMAELIIPERFRAAHTEGLRHFLETGQEGYLRRRVELPAIHRSGREVPAEVRMSPIDLDGTTAFVGCLRDLSARRALQQELHEAERQFRILVESITDYGIYMLDSEGRVTTWNSGAQRIKGYHAEEIIGQHFSRFYIEEDREAGVPAENLRRAAEQGKVLTEGWRVRKDGSRFAANIVVEAIRDAAGRLIGGVAHDFNNLLTIIIGNLAIAGREVEALESGPASRLRRSLASAERGAQRATMLTQRLLAFSRRQLLDPRPLDLNKLIVAEADFMQRTLGESIEVEAVGGGGLWRVEVDQNEFESALLNLAINARDAMPDGGKLTLETGNTFLDQNYCRANPEVLPGQYVLISVTDNGTGMTKEVMDRAFEPFFSTKSVDAGTGLGLSQVYGFIKQSGGHIKIYSEPGEGTTIKIYLPRYTGKVTADETESLESGDVEGRTGET